MVQNWRFVTLSSYKKMKKDVGYDGRKQMIFTRDAKGWAYKQPSWKGCAMYDHGGFYKMWKCSKVEYERLVAMHHRRRNHALSRL